MPLVYQAGTPADALASAIALAGGVVALCDRTGIGRTSIKYWRDGTRRMSRESAAAIECATGVPRDALRPGDPS